MIDPERPAESRQPFPDTLGLCYLYLIVCGRSVMSGGLLSGLRIVLLGRFSDLTQLLAAAAVVFSIFSLIFQTEIGEEMVLFA